MTTNAWPQLKTYLTGEFRIAASKMFENLEDPQTAIYWYSGAYGAVQRVVNIAPEDWMFLLHTVLQHSHAQIQGRIQSASKNAEQPLQLDQEILPRVAAELTVLADSIDADSDITANITNLSRLSYSTTGNGYYLQQTGRIGY